MEEKEGIPRKRKTENATSEPGAEDAAPTDETITERTQNTPVCCSGCGEVEIGALNCPECGKVLRREKRQLPPSLVKYFEKRKAALIQKGLMTEDGRINEEALNRLQEEQGSFSLRCKLDFLVYSLLFTTFGLVMYYQYQFNILKWLSKAFFLSLDPGEIQPRYGMNMVKRIISHTLFFSTEFLWEYSGMNMVKRIILRRRGTASAAMAEGEATKGSGAPTTAAPKRKRDERVPMFVALDGTQRKCGTGWHTEEMWHRVAH
eukprot:g62073.t1